MTTLDEYIDDRLSQGRAYFSRQEALPVLGSTPVALGTAFTRQIRKGRLANPRHGFYLILRPEAAADADAEIERVPDPTLWIDALMKHQGIDYRISLLRAVAFHGMVHQDAPAFQIILPKQVRDFEIGRHRLQFTYQEPAAFAQVNRSDWLSSLKSNAGITHVAGIELTLLDCACHFHKTAGIQGLARIVKELGGQAQPSRLAEAAAHYENSSVRRLGYLLERMGHSQQADALRPFVSQATTAALLNPDITPLHEGADEIKERAPKWMLHINVPIGD